MRLRQTLQIAGCFVISLTITAVALQLSDRHYVARQTELGLSWARQVATQADTLALNAHDPAGEEPLGWAVSLLGQGTDPRPVRIFKIDAGSATSQPETYQLDRASGVFDYSKILMPEKGRGVRVQIQLGYVGFLGARSRIVSDLLALGFFTLCYLTLFLFAIWKFGVAGERRIRALLGNWIGQAKVVLTQFGTHIRELIRGEQELVTGAVQCRELLSGLEARMSTHSRELEDLRKDQITLSQLGLRAETLALSGVIEAARLGPGAKRLIEITEEVHRLVQRQRELTTKIERAGASISEILRVSQAEAHQAHGIAENILGASQGITGQVRQTTDAVMSHAKLMKELNVQLDRQFSGLRTQTRSSSGAGEGTPSAVPS